MSSPQDLDAIAYFVAIAGRGSLTAAAAAIGAPKSTLSRKLAQLEARLGVLLLHRGPRRVRLTAAGEAFLGRCAAALGQIDAAEAEVGALQREPQGVVRLTAPRDLGNHLGAPLLVRFAAGHPQIAVELHLTDRTVPLAEHGLDLALRVGPIQDHALTARPLGEIDGLLVASPAYLARRGAPEEPAQLAGHACLVFLSPPFGATWRLLGPGGATAELAVRGPLAANSLPVVRDAALAGLGVARLPRYMCARELAIGALVRVLPAWSSGARPLAIAYPGRRSLTARARCLLDFIVAQAAAGALWQPSVISL